LVEAILRRHNNVTVFRDERDIHQGEQIDARIRQEIQKMCNIFIALWGREYVESPYCHDEMELRIMHGHMENLYLLRFNDTRPVWRPLRQNPEDRETFYAKWPLVGNDRQKIEKALWEILNDFRQRAAGFDHR